MSSKCKGGAHHVRPDTGRNRYLGYTSYYHLAPASLVSFFLLQAGQEFRIDLESASIFSGANLVASGVLGYIHRLIGLRQQLLLPISIKWVGGETNAYGHGNPSVNLGCGNRHSGNSGSDAFGDLTG